MYMLLSSLFGGRTDKPAAVSSGPKSTGSWDSIHVFEAIDGARTCHYKLTSTVILNMVSSGEGLGEMDLSGNMTRQVENDLPVEDTPAGSERDHISNIGKLVEEMELKMRNLLRTFFLGGFSSPCFSSPKLSADGGGQYRRCLLWKGKGRSGGSEECPCT